MKIHIYILSFFLLFIFYNCNSHTSRLEKLGYSLLTLKKADSFNSEHPNYAVPDVVNVGSGLYSKIRGAKFDESDAIVEITKGDLPYPFGDGKAKYLISIKSENYSGFTVRVRYDRKLDKYHILGFISNNYSMDYDSSKIKVNVID